MYDLIAALAPAFILDLLLGDPYYRFHPARLIGGLISRLERGLRAAGAEGVGGGAALVAITSAISVGLCLALGAGLDAFHSHAGFLFNLYIVYSCLAVGDLLRHALPVRQAIEKGDIPEARKAVSRIVGRDTEKLDRAAIGRAAVETLAENFVDGFFSPLFWYAAGGTAAALFGLPELQAAVCAMLLFKTCSTLDSMVGYRTPPYEYFGKVPARMDDMMNFIPARLSIGVLFAGAVLSRLDAFSGLLTAARDRLNHDSPNAGHAESFAAGALGVSLGGPSYYPDGLKHKPWLGRGTAEIHEGHISAAMTLVRRSAWVSIVLVLSFFLIWAY